MSPVARRAFAVSVRCRYGFDGKAFCMAKLYECGWIFCIATFGYQRLYI